MIGKSWTSRWTEIAPFLSYPPEIRKVIYTTNANHASPARSLFTRFCEPISHIVLTALPTVRKRTLSPSSSTKKPLSLRSNPSIHTQRFQTSGTGHTLPARLGPEKPREASCLWSTASGLKPSSRSTSHGMEHRKNFPTLAYSFPETLNTSTGNANRQEQIVRPTQRQSPSRSHNTSRPKDYPRQIASRSSLATAI
jgi:hypothetical protein